VANGLPDCCLHIGSYFIGCCPLSPTGSWPDYFILDKLSAFGRYWNIFYFS
jgi:hypothetical protein